MNCAVLVLMVRGLSVVPSDNGVSGGGQLVFSLGSRPLVGLWTVHNVPFKEKPFLWLHLQTMLSWCWGGRVISRPIRVGWGEGRGGQLGSSFVSPLRRSHFCGSSCELCCLGVGGGRIISPAIRQRGGRVGRVISSPNKQTLSTHLALTRPQSMTYLMPLIVTEVSAMLVDTTTFLDPCGNGQSRSDLFTLKYRYQYT